MSHALVKANEVTVQPSIVDLHPPVTFNPRQAFEDAIVAVFPPAGRQLSLRAQLLGSTALTRVG